MVYIILLRLFMTRKQSEQILFDEKLKPYYDIDGNKYFCKKCKNNIGSKRERHYEVCLGNGTLELMKTLITYSLLCDMGCGQQSQFYYKTGKAYCCKLAANCPVKVQKDSKNKKNINPWENKEHPRGSLGKSSWNKGLTKENNNSIKLAGEKISQHHQKNPRLNFKHTPESIAKISLTTTLRKQGGYKLGSGRGKIKNYIPDFIVNEKLIEIKGYDSPQWQAKSKKIQIFKFYMKMI